MGDMDKEQAVFEQLILSNFKKWSFSALKTFNNYTTTMTNNSWQIKNIMGIKNIISVSYFWVFQ